MFTNKNNLNIVYKQLNRMFCFMQQKLYILISDTCTKIIYKNKFSKNKN